MSLVSRAANQSPSALGSSASHCLRTLKAHSSNSGLISTGSPDKSNPLVQIFLTTTVRYPGIFFMSATTKAAVHLGQDYQEILRTTKNTDFEKVKKLFDISQKLIPNQGEETFGISASEWKYNSMDENYLAKRQSSQAVDGKGTLFSLIRFFVLAEFMNINNQSLEGEH